MGLNGGRKHWKSDVMENVTVTNRSRLRRKHSKQFVISADIHRKDIEEEIIRAESAIRPTILNTNSITEEFDFCR